MFAALWNNRTQPSQTQEVNTEADYVPCMFIFGLAAGFFTALATGSLVFAAGGCVVGAIIGLALAD
ncbi:MAG: hypothetical protein AAGD32_10790 [Planctomycetota bacterium]